MSQLQESLGEKHKNLFTTSQRVALANKLSEVEDYNDRNVALKSEPSSIATYAATKLLVLESEVQYLEIYRKGLTALHNSGKISSKEYCQEREKYIEAEIERRHEVIPLRLELQVIGQDMREKMMNGAPIEEAYFDAMGERKNAATGNQLQLRHVKQHIVKAVLEYHNANGCQQFGRRGQTWCNVLGWQPSADVEISHIVPRSFDEEPLAYIFGAKVKPSMDLENTLMLHHDIHSKLMSGDVVILPVGGQINQWQCIVTNEELKKEKAMNSMLWENIHKKRLLFNSNNRPARRYLYFRFFMTFVKQKWMGDTDWVQEVEERSLTWPFPAQYLRDSFVEGVADQMSQPEVACAFTGTFPDGGEAMDFEKFKYRNERAAIWFIEAINTTED